MILRLGKRVTIYPSKKIDGRYNKGKIIGVELTKSAHYLGHFGETNYLAQFTVPSYKVAWVDCFTGKGETGWFYEEAFIEPKDNKVTI